MKPIYRLFAFLISISTFFNVNAQMNSIQKSVFGKLADGQTADLFTLKNKNGMEVRITNYGGIITYLSAPDANGKFDNVVLKLESLDAYVKGNPFFGALVGRYGNRIAKGKFILDGQSYSLFINNGENALHGGKKGFDKVIWKANPIEGIEPKLELTYLSKDMEEGYPGNLSVKVTYTLKSSNTLSIHYEATTDKPTVLNLTNHTYFNLTGNPQNKITNHQIKINASAFLPVDKGLIPTGELKPVKNSAFDFLDFHLIGERIAATEEQIQIGNGYDHCWVFDKPARSFAEVVEVYEPTTGRKLKMATDQPATQFYTGNFLNGTVEGLPGQFFQQRSGFCLETQHFPDSPNQPKFPSTVLRPGEKYETTTEYTFYH